MRRKFYLFLILAAVALTAASCKKDDGPKVPCFLHLDKVVVCHPSDGSTTQFGDAFLTSAVDAVQVECWFEEDDTTTNLGTFELPCDIPLLTNHSKIKKVQVYPFVMQNGINATHIYYPYYEFFVDSNLVVAPDSTTNIGTLNAEGEWTIKVPYRSTRYMKILKSEFFEPLQLSIAFDTNVERVNDASMARSGQGYGRVHFDSETATKTFYMNDKLKENNPTAYLYLEMDYWVSTNGKDARLEVGMESSVTVGGNPSLAGCMTIYANQGWNKIYVNLGRAWNYFNYNPEFRLAFSILNVGGAEGDIYLDNIKVLSY